MHTILQIYTSVKWPSSSNSGTRGMWSVSMAIGLPRMQSEKPSHAQVVARASQSERTSFQSHSWTWRHMLLASAVLHSFSGIIRLQDQRLRHQQKVWCMSADGSYHAKTGGDERASLSFWKAVVRLGPHSQVDFLVDSSRRGLDSSAISRVNLPN